MYLKKDGVLLILRKMKNWQQTKLSLYEKMNEIHEYAINLGIFEYEIFNL